MVQVSNTLDDTLTPVAAVPPTDTVVPAVNAVPFTVSAVPPPVVPDTGLTAVTDTTGGGGGGGSSRLSEQPAASAAAARSAWILTFLMTLPNG